jgi:hypothetical protein
VPALIADTGPLVAILNAKDRHHEACTALFRRFRGPIIVPAPIVTEAALFRLSEVRPQPRVSLDEGIHHDLLPLDDQTSQPIRATTPQIDFSASCSRACLQGSRPPNQAAVCASPRSRTDHVA